eukprot:Phypoly_transcript_02036.p1 GENE.Phypoly_transcript_02036~~Phypoly_transcript_02036.p1  ORF type:complete len:423 (+),score=56.75 Phypoly_transcript_02036:1716-2984(+)
MPNPIIKPERTKLKRRRLTHGRSFYAATRLRCHPKDLKTSCTNVREPTETDSSQSENGESENSESENCESENGESEIETKSNKRQRITEVPTLHHTFKILCSTCGTLVPVKDLGDEIIAPTCKNWVLACSGCTGGTPEITYPAEVSIKEKVLRALFWLHTQDPQKGFFTSNAIARVLKYNCSFKAEKTCGHRSLNSVADIVAAKLAHTSEVISKSKTYHFLFQPPDEPHENSKKGDDLSQIASLPEKEISPEDFMSCTTIPEETNSNIHIGKGENLEGHKRQEVKSGAHFRTDENFVPVHDFTVEYDTHFSEAIPESLQPSVDVFVGWQGETDFICFSSVDVFVGWQGETDFIGFVRVTLDMSLKEMRGEIMENNLVQHNEHFFFWYKKAHVQLCQESRLFICECVTESEGSCYLRLKRHNV